MEKNTRLFIACVIAIVATAFGFIVRSVLLTELGTTFNLSQTQLGALGGAGLFPFALSIIFVSLFVDKIGYGRAMLFAWIGHVVSAILTMTAKSYGQLYFGTLIFALANGIVEAVANPVVATMFAKDKVRHLNILHSGWAGGQVVAGLILIVMGTAAWQMKIGLFLLPAVVYGVMMLGCKFPVNERVTAGVSYRDMLKEFGWAGCLLISFFAAQAFNAISSVFGDSGGISSTWIWIITIVPTVIFMATVRSFGRPLFVLILLIMTLSATTELGTNNWVSDLLTGVMNGKGFYVLIYTSAIMFVLRFFSAGALIKKFSPVGLLAICSGLSAVGLLLLANAGNSQGMIFVAATFFGVGITFFWPTTLGIVSEQFPRGGALTLNAMGGMGMIAVGTLGAATLGTLQDKKIDIAVHDALPAIHQQIAEPPQTSNFITYQALDKKKLEALPAAQKAQVDQLVTDNKQKALTYFAILPILMTIGWGLIGLYFKSRGGYKAVDIAGAAH